MFVSISWLKTMEIENNINHSEHIEQLDFDRSIFRLGRVCKNGHDFNGLNQSIRYISNGRCIDCKTSSRPYLKREKNPISDHLLGTFDSLVFRLSTLCSQRHDFGETGKSLRYVSSGVCVECHKIYQQKRYQENRDEILAQQAEYRSLNQEKRSDYRRRLYQKNKEHHLQQHAEYRRKNKTKIVAYQAEYYRKNKTKINQKAAKYRAENQESIKRQKREHYQKNKAGYRQWAERYRRENSEKIREQKRNYRRSPRGKLIRLRNTQKRRALKKQIHHTHFTPEMLQSHFAYFGDRCAYCEAEGDLTIDHFIALTKGGSDCLGNIIPACKSCNSRKHNFDPKDWFQKQPFYSKRRWNLILKVLGKTDRDYDQIPLF